MNERILFHLVSFTGHCTLETMFEIDFQLHDGYYNHCTIRVASNGLRVCVTYYRPTSSLMLHVHEAAVYRAAWWGGATGNDEHRRLCTEYKVWGWLINECARLSIHWRWVCHDSNLRWFMASVISHSQCMRTFEMGSPSCTCTPLLFDMSYSPAHQDMATQIAARPFVVLHWHNATSPARH